MTNYDDHDERDAVNREIALERDAEERDRDQWFYGVQYRGEGRYGPNSQVMRCDSEDEAREAVESLAIDLNMPDEDQIGSMLPEAAAAWTQFWQDLRALRTSPANGIAEVVTPGGTTFWVEYSGGL